MEFEIGQTVRNKKNSSIEVVKTIKYGYVNGYRADLFELVNEEKVASDSLPEQILTNIVLGTIRWNKKFYANSIYINNVKYTITYDQREELGRHFELDV